MSFNGSGTFLVNSSGQPPVASTAITVAAHVALTGDLATGLSTCITKDGQTTTTAVIPFAAGLSTTSITNSTGLASGTYTPTITNTTNIDSSSAGTTMYMRIGNIVHVEGYVVINPTAAGSTATVLGISLPIASNFGSDQDCSGFANIPGWTAGAISGDSSNDRATVDLLSLATTDTGMRFGFSYRVI